MIGFTEKDIEAVAMLRPVTRTSAKLHQENVEKLIAKAHLERSIYISSLVKKIFSGNAGESKATSVIDFPETTINTTGVMDVDQFLVEARSRQAKAFYAGFISIVKQIAAKISAHRESRKAADKLFSMNPRELDDLGLSYGDIEAAVYGQTRDRVTLTARFSVYVKALSGRFNQWQKNRAGHAGLMAMDDRSLADLGISRGEIYAVHKFGRDVVNAKANDNINHEAANDDHRQAV